MCVMIVFFFFCLFLLLLHLLDGLSVTGLVRSSAGVLGTQEGVPEGEEWLRKVGLDSPVLMMNVMVCSIIAGNELERVPGE